MLKQVFFKFNVITSLADLIKKAWNKVHASYFMVIQEGFEPPTHGLEVAPSTIHQILLLKSQ